jgi:hypothetical protein
MATMEMKKTTFEHDEVAGELTDSVTLARQEDAGTSSLRTDLFRLLLCDLCYIMSYFSNIHLVVRYHRLTNAQTIIISPSSMLSRKTRQLFYGVYSSSGLVCSLVSRVMLLGMSSGSPNLDRTLEVSMVESMSSLQSGNRHLQQPPQPRKYFITTILSSSAYTSLKPPPF